MTRIAIVHEWVSARTGSELCFERLAALFPEADLFALSHDLDIAIETGGRPIRTTFLDSLARSQRGRAVALPLMPLAFANIRSDKYDIVISSSHAFSRSFANSSAIHFSYTYSPLRYAWYPEVDRRGQGWHLAPFRGALRAVDKRFASNVNSFAAISTEVAGRIERCYGAESETIFPPCDTEYFVPPTSSTRQSDPYLLSVGRFIPYKRHDLAISLGEAVGMRVVLAGAGPDLQILRQLAYVARTSVTIIESPTRETIRELYQGAYATVFPPFEDFGIVPVESLSCGTPVIGLAAGGSLDTIGNDGGELATDQSCNAFVNAFHRLESARPSVTQCRKQAGQFSIEAFDSGIRAWVDSVI